MKRTALFLILLLVVASQFRSQNFDYNFNKDSLQGFDQEKLNQLISKYPNDIEIKNEVSFVTKRNFINEKYNLKRNESIEKTATSLLNKINLSSACDNEDFELTSGGAITASNQVQGWLITNGTNSVIGGSCNIYDTIFTNGVGSVMINGGNYIDPIIGSIYPLNSVFGVGLNGGQSANPSVGQMFGNSFIRLSNTYSDYSSDQISKRMKITNANSLFRYAYIFVASGGHACCDGAVFRVGVTDITTNSVLTNYSNIVNVFPVTNQCAPTTADTFYNVGTNIIHTSSNNSSDYTKWKIVNVDLSAYVGDSISVYFMATDCVAGGHFGYAYVDTQCSPLQMFVNSNIITSESFTACNSATLSAPPNLNYLWNGPVSSSITNVTTQSVVANSSGIYTLNLMSGTVTLNVQTVSITVNNSSSVVVMADNYTICTGGIANLSANGNGLITYTWSNGSNTQVTSVTPSITTMYSVAVTNSLGCLSNGFVGINVFDCTTIEQQQIAKTYFSIYPNPNSGSFILSSNAEEKINIYDNLGRFIQAIELNQANNYKFAIQNYKPGIYLVKGSFMTSKIVVLD